MTQDTGAFKPLRGVRVLDLSRYLPGPYLTRILADFGADIVKVESPQGDPARYMPPQKGDFAAFFASVNAGKRSIVIDFKKPEGVELVKSFVPKCDVVVESFRPGVADRLGIGYAALKEINPRIIMCSISGYGQTGPLANVPGHDINYVARAGVLGLFGPADGLPAVPGVQMADVGGGSLTAATGVLAALIERDKTGVGRFLDISMTRSVMSLAVTSSAVVGLGVDTPRGQGFLSGGIPCYRIYETKDGRFMALGALEPKFFATFCSMLGADHLTQHVYAVGEECKKAMGELETIFKEKTQAEWVEFFAGADVCCEPVRSMEEAVADPELGLVATEVHGACTVLPHFGVDPSLDDIRDAPALGAHGKELLREFEIDSNLVEAAKGAGAVVLGDS